MTNCRISAGANVRLAVVGCLVAIGLAACGSGDGTGGSGAAAVSPNVGVIARNHPPGGGTVTPPSTGTGVPPQGSQSGGKPPSSPTAGTATLDWVPPTQNSDGSSLTNLAGYYVYYGTSPENLTESVKVSNPGLSAFTVGNLTSGTWYFAVSAYTSSGVESARTNVISTTI